MIPVAGAPCTQRKTSFASLAVIFYAFSPSPKTSFRGCPSAIKKPPCGGFFFVELPGFEPGSKQAAGRLSTCLSFY
jgi:hypothetical protein